MKKKGKGKGKPCWRVLTCIGMVLVLSGWSGCSWLCKNVPPAKLASAQESLRALQGTYDLLVAQYVGGQANLILKTAMVSTDAALSILGEQLKSKCPDPKKIDLGVVTAQGALEAQAAAGVK